jgi:mannosyltransferase
MKREHWKLFAILLLSAIFRCIALESRGIWYDDVFSIFLSRQPFPAIVTGTAADTMPPLYYFLLHTWMAIGQSTWFLRSLNVLISVGSVALVYMLATRLFSSTAGLWAAFLAAISPLQIYHAQELRSYALLAFFEIGYALCFIRLLQAANLSKKWDWIGFVIFGAGALYSHNMAVFTIIVPNIFLLLKRDWKFLKRILVAQIGMGVLFLPWLIYLPGQIAKVQRAFSIPKPGLVELIQSIVIFTSNLPLPGLWLALALFLSLLGMVLLMFELAHEREMNDGLLLLAAFTILPPLLMVIVSYTMRPVFATRGFIFSALAYDGLTGYVISRRWPGAGMALVGIFVAGALVALPYQYQFQAFPRSPFQQAAAYLENVIQPGDRVIDDNKLSGFPMRYYAPGLPEAYLPDIPLSGNDTLAPATEDAMGIHAANDLTSAVADSRRIYFVVFDQARNEYQEIGESEHPVIAQLRQKFPLMSQFNFGDLEIYRFER